MFSKACEYGIRACIYIATESSVEKKIRIDKIAEQIKAPKAFTSKVLQQLVRHGIIFSSKGPRGGFYITEEKAKKTEALLSHTR